MLSASRKKWVQKNCLVPFYSIEASQAVLHTIFAIVTTVFSILVLLETRKKPIRTSSQSVNHYAQICAAKVANGPNSLHGSSSGYENSTYDDLRSQGSAREKVHENERERKEVKGQFERNSKKKKKKDKRPSMPVPDCPPCSSNSKSSEEESNQEDVYTQPIKKKPQPLRVNKVVTHAVDYFSVSATGSRRGEPCGECHVISQFRPEECHSSANPTAFRSGTLGQRGKTSTCFLKFKLCFSDSRL